MFIYSYDRIKFTYNYLYKKKLTEKLKNQPTVPGLPAIPGQDGGHGNGGARGPKYPRATEGRQHQLTLATYNGAARRAEEHKMAYSIPYP